MVRAKRELNNIQVYFDDKSGTRVFRDDNRYIEIILSITKRKKFSVDFGINIVF